jgi:hypothetical protein
MEARQWGALRLELRNELNLGDQGLVEDAELMVMANRALQFAESEIHSLNEDYFRTFDTLTLVKDIATYGLPTRAYGAKLRLVQYDDGSSVYEVTRIKLKDIGNVGDGDEYRYDLDNSATYGCRMVFFPTPSEGGAYIKRWYLRRVNEITSDASYVDLPEFSTFVFAYIKVQVLLKSDGVTSPALLSAAQAELQMARDLMVRSLSSIVVDEAEGDLELDFSFYNDSEA